MKLITKKIHYKLIKNHEEQKQCLRENKPIVDHKPVVRLFTPDANAQWLITEADSIQPDILFGLCDLGLGLPELGYVSLKELESVRGKLGLPVERELCFEADKTLAEYTKEALLHGCIIT